MSEDDVVERSLPYRILAGSMGAVFLLAALFVAVTGWQIQPCPGGYCAFYNRFVASNLAGRAAFLVLGVLAAWQGGRIAVTGEETLHE